MTAQTMFVIAEADLKSLRDELSALHRKLDGVVMTPRPEWLNINDYAAFIGKSRSTVMRLIAGGRVEVKHIAGVRMVRV